MQIPGFIELIAQELSNQAIGHVGQKERQLLRQMVAKRYRAGNEVVQIVGIPSRPRRRASISTG